AALPASLAPRAIAVGGASGAPSRGGGRVPATRRAAAFAGRIAPVNARAAPVQGLPAAPSLRAVAGPVDLAVIAVPAADVLPALKECVAIGVGGAVVISAGFREAGPEGQGREAQLRALLPRPHPPVPRPDLLRLVPPPRP